MSSSFCDEMSILKGVYIYYFRVKSHVISTKDLFLFVRIVFVYIQSF